MKFLEMFSEKGDISMTRVMSFIVCLTGCYVSIKHQDATLAAVLLSIAFTGKVAQKVFEAKNG